MMRAIGWGGEPGGGEAGGGEIVGDGPRDRVDALRVAADVQGAAHRPGAGVDEAGLQEAGGQEDADAVDAREEAQRLGLVDDAVLAADDSHSLARSAAQLRKRGERVPPPPRP